MSENTPVSRRTGTDSTRSSTHSKSKSPAETAAMVTDANLENELWYWPDISRDQVNSWMLNKPDGTFLVRNSSDSEKNYTLTLRKEGVNKLIKIYQRDGRFGFSLNEDLPFTSVVELVHYYQVHSLKEYNHNLNITLKQPLNRPKLGEDDEGHQKTADELRSSVRLLHVQYLRKTRQYDSIHEQLTQAAQQLEYRRQAIQSYKETQKWFDSQVHLLEKGLKYASELQRIKVDTNLKMQHDRIKSLQEYQQRLSEELKNYSQKRARLERQMNAIKPRLFYLYKKKDRHQWLLKKSGYTEDDLEMLLQQTAEECVNEIEDDNMSDNTVLNNVTGGSSFIKQLSRTSSCDSETVDGEPSSSKVTSHRSSPGVKSTAVKEEPSRTEAWDDDRYLLPAGTTKEKALHLLYGRSHGTFLLRPSTSRPGWFALDIMCNGNVYHCLVEYAKPTPHFRGGFGFAISSQSGSDLEHAVVLPSLHELVSHYAAHSLRDHNPALDTRLVHPVFPIPNE